MTANYPAGTPLDKSADFWLNELRATHAKLLSAIEELARLTAGPPPHKHLLVDTRWQLSSASLARRLLWGRIHAFLSKHPDHDLEADLGLLQQRDIELLRASTQHVTRWTTDEVLADWQGYRGASHAMRQKMIDAIMHEKQLLCSVLSKFIRSTLQDSCGGSGQPGCPATFRMLEVLADVVAVELPRHRESSFDVVVRRRIAGSSYSVEPFERGGRVFEKSAQALDMTEKRETPRHTIKAEVHLKRRGAINYEVRAYDLSQTGCKVEFVEKPWLGETVWVKFEGLESLRSTVRWSGDFTVGLEFERPIDSRVLDWLLRGLD